MRIVDVMFSGTTIQIIGTTLAVQGKLLTIQCDVSQVILSASLWSPCVRRWLHRLTLSNSPISNQMWDKENKKLLVSSVQTRVDFGLASPRNKGGQSKGAKNCSGGTSRMTYLSL